jgi:hypothetical protein
VAHGLWSLYVPLNRVSAFLLAEVKRKGS